MFALLSSLHCGGVKVQTVADIESVLSEMRLYVLDQERHDKIKESDTERRTDDEAE